MYQFYAVHQIITVKLPEFSLSFQTFKNVLRVNKSEITSENAFNGDLFNTEDNHESSKDRKTLFQVFLQICYPCFNPQTVKYVYLELSSYVFFCNFQAVFRGFGKLRIRSINFTLNFEKVECNFWRLNVLVFCCRANQYSEITSIFFEVSNRKPRSKG